MLHWENLIATVSTNQPELGGLVDLSEQLEAEMEGAKDATVRQAAAKAAKQQARKDLLGFLFRGTDLAYRLRTGIQTQYGFRSEKLTEFGMRVTRSRRAASQEEAPEQPEPPVVEAQAPEAKALESKKKAPPAATTKVKSQ
jgi:hypothetical protein